MIPVLQPDSAREDVMLFMLSANLTDQGVHSLKDAPKRA
jgi:uncharacterized protein with GYD domain